MPIVINLDCGGLRHSSRIRHQEAEHLCDTPTRLFANTTRVATKACLVLFSLFCADGLATSWLFVTKAAQSINVSQGNATSVLANAVNSYHQVNSLYD